MLKKLLCLFFVVNGFSMNDETGCTGSCEAKWTSRITTSFCVFCCCSSTLRMIPSEDRSISPTGFFDVKPEVELVFGVTPWIVAGIPATFANYNYDGHSCICGNCKVVGKCCKEGTRDFSKKCWRVLLSYLSPIDLDKEE
jgi:hypothetical protein